MTTKAISNKFPRNLPCPCGSGKKYKHCCVDRDYILNDKGDTLREIEMGEDVAQLMQHQIQAFTDRFGRKPEAGDPLMFDPDKDSPVVMDEESVQNEMVAAMTEARVRPELIYAFKKTGRIVSEENLELLNDTELQEWQDAIDEYFDLNGGD